MQTRIAERKKFHFEHQKDLIVSRNIVSPYHFEQGITVEVCISKKTSASSFISLMDVINVYIKRSTI